jgi:hypothetical protein
VIPETVPVKVGLAIGAFEANDVVTLDAKLASSPKAAANSSRVSSAAGAELITDAMAFLTLLNIFKKFLYLINNQAHFRLNPHL